MHTIYGYVWQLKGASGYEWYFDNAIARDKAKQERLRESPKPKPLTSDFSFQTRSDNDEYIEKQAEKHANTILDK